MGMSNAAIDFIAANPRSTAKEAGLTNAEANALVGAGRLIPVGNRVTGKRGRPPMEYVVAGTELSEDAMVQAQVQEAVERVEASRRWERLSSAIMRAENEYGYHSEQRAEARLARLEGFPLGPPEIPSKNDYVLAGAAADVSVGVEDDSDVPELVEA